MKARLGGAAIAALSVAACMPMEQASLIYTSTDSIGVNVEAGTPQQPGLVVSIGYRGLDAAFVPVIASKHCPENQADLCKDINYRPIEIAGTSNRGNTSETTDDGEIANLASAIQKRAGDIAALESTTTGQRERLKELNTLTTQLAELRAPRPPAQPAEGDQPDAATVAAALAESQRQIERRIADLERSGSATALATRIADNERTIGGLKVDQSRDEARLATAEQHARSDIKDDSYSVFGSFDGGAGGTANGATLQLGQLFSTGIASQNLTQGMGEATLMQRRTQCIDALRAQAGMTADKLEKLVPVVCVTTDPDAKGA